MLFKKAILPLLILASLSGCGPAVLDGTSPDTLDASIAKLANKLPGDQRPQFGVDVELVKSYYAKQSQDQLLFNLNGKNAAEIATEANNLREQLKLEEEKLAVEEMKKAYLVELAEKKASLLESIKPLEESKNQSLDRARFQVVKSNISLAKKETSGERMNAIDLTVTNGSSQEIYGAFFSATLSVPGEEKPRLESVIDVQFENGLQPGETRSLMFVPTLASEWRSVELPTSGVFNLVTDELMNIANKPLFSQARFTPDDQVALDSLNAELATVNLELGVADGSTEKAPEAGVEQAPVAQQEPKVESSLPSSLLPEANADSSPPLIGEPATESGELPSDVQAEPEIREYSPEAATDPSPVEPAAVPVAASAPTDSAAPTAPAPAPAPAPVAEAAPALAPAPTEAPVEEKAPFSPADDVDPATLAPTPPPATVRIEDVSPNSASTPKRVQAKHS